MGATAPGARPVSNIWRQPLAVGLALALAVAVGGALAAWAALSLPIHFLGWGTLSFALLLLLVLAVVREYLKERA